MAKQRNPAPIIHVDIVSDIVCPWCWLGYRYFAQAAKKSGRKIKLSWRPFMLDASTPKEGVPYKDYMRSKFGDGPSNKFIAMREHLESAGPELGIDFKFSGIPMRPNTMAAHRLMRWAEGQELGSEAAEALFQAFFTDHKDVGDINVLAEIAESLGMDGELTAKLLESDQDEAAVTEELFFYRDLGVNSVPTFIYNGQFAIQGAQELQAHLKAIEEAAKHPA